MPATVSVKFYPGLVPVCPRKSVGTTKKIPYLGLVGSNHTEVKYFPFIPYSFISLLRLTPSGKFATPTLIHKLVILLMYQTILIVTVVRFQWHCYLLSLLISALLSELSWKSRRQTFRCKFKFCGNCKPLEKSWSKVKVDIFVYEPSYTSGRKLSRFL